METVRVLLLEDADADAELIRSELLASFGETLTIRRVASHEAFIRQLEAWRPELVIADYGFSMIDGGSVLGLTRESNPDLPFIYMSRSMLEGAALDAMRAGATDYVFKDRLARLGPSVRRALHETEERRQRKLAEEALRQSEERYRHVVELSPDAVVVHRDGVVLFINQAGAEMLRSSPEQLVGRSLFDLIDSAYHALAMQRSRKLQAGEKLPVVEILCRGTEGTAVPLEVISTPIRYGGEEATLSIGRDLRDRKRLEREILEVSGREQRRIGQHLHEVLGQNLAGAAFLGKALEQQLQHRDASLADEARKVVGLIIQSVSQARALSRSLCPIDMVQNGLAIALRELAANIRECFGVACTFEEKGTAPFDDTTATHLYYIALEATNNAAKHGGGNRIKISLEACEDHWVLSVEDNGHGFNEEEARKKEGIGLRIMDYRCRVIGASLEILTAPEGGTTIRCTLHP